MILYGVKTVPAVMLLIVEIMIFLPNDLIEFQVHNLVHKEPSPERVEMYQLRMNNLTMEKNGSRMINQMQYYVRLLLYFFRKNGKFPSLLLMELELKANLLG